MGDAPLEGDRLELDPAGRLARRRRISTFTMLDDLRASLEPPDLADPRDVPAVPLHPELEVLVGIEALGVDGELSHLDLPQTADCPAICWSRRTTNSAGLSGAKPTSM